MTVWFVGSNPSKKNVCPNIPFWGTKSWTTLRSWMVDMDVHKFGLMNVSNEVTSGDVPEVTQNDLARVLLKLKGELYVVALGNTASLVLNRLGIKHFKLPHPSGRNRLLNDKNFVRDQLKNCKLYLRAREINNGENQNQKSGTDQE